VSAYQNAPEVGAHVFLTKLQNQINKGKRLSGEELVSSIQESLNPNELATLAGVSILSLFFDESDMVF
jgi:hypothetical protein